MTSLRPVDNWQNAVTIFTDLYLISITEVNEKAQSISTQITVAHGWGSDFTLWNPDDFCGMKTCTVTKDMIWTPDIMIAESIKTEYATPDNQNVMLKAEGIVVLKKVLAATTACKMNLFLFPFDVQSCTFTLQSPVFPIDELKVNPFSDATFLTQTSQKAFQTEGEWELLNISISKSTIAPMGDVLDQLVYKCNGGEKLGFKVTLLLAISVLLLLLKDMLPSTAKAIPLIGVYCIVIFTLIGISILETILVSFLMSKGNDNDIAAAMRSISDLTANVKNSEDTFSNKIEEHPKTPVLQKKCVNWTKVARAVDLIFFILYVITVILFLILLSKAWFE
ncbi:hypothetical protein DNTS_028683 [Danionella cerebrum]|uniref:Neurotransmitter-gated ion-channel ligand-binding domain-containing protein n=1 Tax=Danionella cerebrum TaxID=2873325 RepID=A0A553RLI5_9TELE|nr:hypothetical protein DNTS_028683 [Danionella translucida]